MIILYSILCFLAITIFLLVILLFKPRKNKFIYEKQIDKILLNNSFSSFKPDEMHLLEKIENNTAFFRITKPGLYSAYENNVYSQYYIVPKLYKNNKKNIGINAFFIRKKPKTWFEQRFPQRSTLFFEFLLNIQINEEIIIFRESFNTKLMRKFFPDSLLVEDVDIESMLFNHKYQVFTNNKKIAFKLLDPLIVDFLNKEKYVSLIIKENSIIFKIWPKISEKKLKQYLNIGVKFVKHIKSIYKK
ncbi:MAG: hypothetical protein U5L76_04205 [Patescibacteria group bacterium]|nr:hypothetical protein [Patescibacteria group bacterium]